MINSYGLHLNHHKIILIHGFNNTKESLYPLQNALQNMGHEVEILTLPGHGNDRKEAKDLEKARTIFHQSLLKITNKPFVVIAFSYGATYFQNWMDSNKNHQCIGQILLAPALFIKKWPLINTISYLLPSSFYIKSLTPQIIRHYQELYVCEYRLLFKSISYFHLIKNKLPIKTMIIIDPQDELIHVKKTKRELSGPLLKFTIWPRNQIPHSPGPHHALIHPAFFEKDNWNKLLDQIDNFIKEVTLKKV